jgi:hypothetical protein
LRSIFWLPCRAFIRVRVHHVLPDSEIFIAMSETLAIPSTELEKTSGPASEADFPGTERASLDKRELSTPDHEAPVPAPKEEAEYPKSWRLLLISIALCLAVFCIALDNTIIATALPKITDTFEALNGM